MRKAGYIAATMAVVSLMGSSIAQADSELAMRIASVRPGHTTRFNLGSLPAGISPAIELYIDHHSVGAVEVLRPDLYQHPVSESVAVGYGLLVIIDVPASGPIVVEATSSHGKHRLGIIESWTS